jgi:hypothetical protein
MVTYYAKYTSKLAVFYGNSPFLIGEWNSPWLPVRPLGCRADWDRKPGQSMDGDRMAIAWDNQEMWANLWIDLKEHLEEIVFLCIFLHVLHIPKYRDVLSTVPSSNYLGNKNPAQRLHKEHITLGNPKSQPKSSFC